jgi:hypothetical protein
MFQRIQETRAEWDRDGPCTASLDQVVVALIKETGAGS